MLLRFGGLSCLVAASTALAGAVMIPIAPPVAEEISTAGTWLRPPSAVEQPVQVSRAEFQPVWRKKLQGPLVDAPTRKPPAEKKEKPAGPVVKLRCALVGTLADTNPEFARAWFKSGNDVHLVKIGQAVPGESGQVILTAVSDGHAELSVAGKSRILKLPKTEFADSAVAENQAPTSKATPSEVQGVK